MPKFAQFNVDESWTSTGIADTLTLNIPLGTGRQGIQLDMAGVDLTTVTITAHTHAGATKVVEVESGAGPTTLIGDDFEMTKIVVTGLPAGTYTYRFGLS